MRILFITTGLKLGGAEQQIAALAQAFVNLGHKIAVLSLTDGCEVKLPSEVTVISLGMRKSPLSMLHAIGRARRFIRQWCPDIIHAHMIHGNLFARALTSFGSMPPLVCSAHSAREGGRLRALAYRLTDRWCALTTHVSQAGRNAMVQGGAIRADRITVMPNGIDTSRFAPEPSARQRVRQSLGLDASEIVLLSVGRLVAEKDHALLIDAFAEVLRTDLQIRLLIAGDGPLRNELQAQIGRLQLGHSVQLLGSREDIPDLLRSADVFVLSSNIEGMPLVVCEAMATGLPVVATDAAGVREIAGDLAIITPVGDRITLAQALQRAISRLPTAPGMRARYRERIIENFDVTTIARRWLAQYRRLMEGCRCAA